MPIRSNLVERAAFRLNLAPAVMADYLGAQAFKVFSAANRLGVFHALADAPLSSGEIATRLEADARGTDLLLHALVALGYLRQREDRYSLSRMTAKWLPVVADGIAFFEILSDRMAEVGDAVRRGGPAVDARTWLDQRQDGWRDFEAGMVALARLSVAEVAARVKLPAGATGLLDVGGGHGLYAIELCRRHPRLFATVFDLPQALEAASDSVSQAEMSDRVELRAGDFFVDDLGQGYDVALLFNIIHGMGREKNLELLGKVAKAMAPGGRIVILDQLVGPMLGPTADAVAALNGLALFTINGGQTYAFEDVAGWLDATGFRRPRRRRLFTSPGSWLVTAARE